MPTSPAPAIFYVLKNGSDYHRTEETTAGFIVRPLPGCDAMFDNLVDEAVAQSGKGYIITTTLAELSSKGRFSAATVMDFTG